MQKKAQVSGLTSYENVSLRKWNVWLRKCSNKNISWCQKQFNYQTRRSRNNESVAFVIKKSLMRGRQDKNVDMESLHKSRDVFFVSRDVLFVSSNVHNTLRHTR